MKSVDATTSFSNNAPFHISRAMKHWKNRGMAAAWTSWRDYIIKRRENKKIITRWMQPMKV